MDGFQYLLSKVLSPFMSPILPGERIYWLYIGSALIIAFVVYLATYASKRAGLIKGFITYCFPKNVFAHKSAIVDYKYFLINKITFAILFAPLIIGSSVVSGWSISASSGRSSDSHSSTAFDNGRAWGAPAGVVGLNPCRAIF